MIRRMVLEKPTIEGKGPVVENIYSLEWILSTTEHVKFRRNLGGPSPKAKYSLVTDSEPVPWGKGEKHPDEGSETVSETGRLQAVGAALSGDGVPFV